MNGRTAETPVELPGQLPLFDVDEIVDAGADPQPHSDTTEQGEDDDADQRP